MEQIIALLTLVLLEIVLGIDNVIFISIVTSRLPQQSQKKIRRTGLLLAMLMRLILLTGISFILKLDSTLFTVFNNDISGKDIILVLGGLFLLYKSTTEIHHKVDNPGSEEASQKKATTAGNAIIQILLLDLVFSIDSIITAIGMVEHLWVMYVAVVVSVGVMLFAAEPIANFVNKYPAFKILALSFLMIIGLSLVAEGFDVHIPKGYIYFSIAFALGVDVLQMKMSKSANKQS